MRAAIAAYDAHAAEAGISKAGELKVTLLSHWESGEARVDTHVQPLGARPPSPVKIQVRAPVPLQQLFWFQFENGWMARHRTASALDIITAESADRHLLGKDAWSVPEQ
jgi:hypothetical protein